MPTIEIDNNEGTRPALIVSTKAGTHHFIGNKATVSEEAAAEFKAQNAKVTEVTGDGGLVTNGGDPYDHAAAAADVEKGLVQSPAQNPNPTDEEDLTETEKAAAGLPNKATGKAAGTAALSDKKK